MEQSVASAAVHWAARTGPGAMPAPMQVPEHAASGSSIVEVQKYPHLMLPLTTPRHRLFWEQAPLSGKQSAEDKQVALQCVPACHWQRQPAATQSTNRMHNPAR